MRTLFAGRALAAVAAISLSACGGGGSSTPGTSVLPPGGAPGPTAPPSATPTPTPAPTPTPIPILTTADYSLQPIFECVNHPSGPTFYLRFGYRSLNANTVQVLRDSEDPTSGALLNTVVVTSGESGEAEYTQQPTQFSPGDQSAAFFEVPVGGEGSATWYLAGNEVTGSASMTTCSSRGGEPAAIGRKATRTR